jgi:hypothetical protein
VSDNGASDLDMDLLSVGMNRPLKMIANALRVAFHRIANRALLRPVGSGRVGSARCRSGYGVARVSIGRSSLRDPVNSSSVDRVLIADPDSHYMASVLVDLLVKQAEPLG